LLQPTDGIAKVVKESCATPAGRPSSPSAATSDFIIEPEAEGGYMLASRDINRQRMERFACAGAQIDGMVCLSRRKDAPAQLMGGGRSTPDDPRNVRLSA